MWSRETPPSGCSGGLSSAGPTAQQLLAIQSEQALCVFVHVDEAARIGIQHDDSFRRVIDEQAIARFALAHGLLGLATISDVTQTHHVHLAPTRASVTDGKLDGERAAVLAQAPRLACSEIHMRIAGACSKPLQCLWHGLVLSNLRDQQIDALTDNFRFAEREYPFAGGIEGADHALLVHRQHDVLDVIEDDLQMFGALRAHFVRHGARFVCHETHRLHDAATFFVDGLVMRADETEERTDIDDRRAAAQAQLTKLSAQMRMQFGTVFAHERVRIDAHDGRRARRYSFARARRLRIPWIGTRPKFGCV